EGDVLAGDVLQLDGHVFEDVAEPGAVAFAHAADEAAGFAVAAAVFLQAGQGGHEGVDVGRPQARRRPGFELAQVQHQLEDREVRVQRRADVDVAFQDAHARGSARGEDVGVRESL